MPRKTLRNAKVFTATFFGTLFFVGVIIFFMIGGVDFARKYPRVLHYGHSVCEVDARNYTIEQCHGRYHRYTCYTPKWEARYGSNLTIYAQVETEKRYHSRQEAIDEANEYQIGMSYSCWYDKRNSTIARWDRPTVFIETILLICGGVSVLLCLLSCFLTYRFVQQDKLKYGEDIFYALY